MKNCFNKLVAAVLLLVMFPAPGHAQDQPFQMRLNILMNIDGSQGAEFDRSWKVIAGQAKEDQFPFYTVVSESGNQRLILLIVKSYGDISKVAEQIDRYTNSDDAELKEAVHNFQNVVESYQSYVSRIAGNLTYNPPDSYRSGFVRYSHYTIESEDKPEVTKLVKDYRDMLEEVGVSSALHARWLTLGSEGTVLELLRAADSPEEMQEFEKEIAAKVDAGMLHEFQSRLDGLTLSVSHRNWTPRPDLSISTRR